MSSPTGRRTSPCREASGLFPRSTEAKSKRYIPKCDAWLLLMLLRSLEWVKVEAKLKQAPSSKPPKLQKPQKNAQLWGFAIWSLVILLSFKL